MWATRTTNSLYWISSGCKMFRRCWPLKPYLEFFNSALVLNLQAQTQKWQTEIVNQTSSHFYFVLKTDVKNSWWSFQNKVKATWSLMNDFWTAIFCIWGYNFKTKANFKIPDTILEANNCQTSCNQRMLS